MSDVKDKSRLAKVIYVVEGDNGRAPLRVVINQGSNDGVKVGDPFIVFGIGPHIKDPDTGADLGELEIVRGHGEVVHLQESMATIRSTERRHRLPARANFRGLSLVEEAMAPATELPFESVQLGDYAKPI